MNNLVWLLKKHCVASVTLVEREYDGLKDKLSQTTGPKNKLADQMNHFISDWF